MKKILTWLALAGPVGCTAQTMSYQSMPVSTGASGLVQELANWKAANDTVSQYPGHSAIVRWERTQHPGSGISGTAVPARAADHPSHQVRPQQEPTR